MSKQTKFSTGDLVKIVVKHKYESFLNGKIGLYLNKSKYPFSNFTNDVLINNEVYMFGSKELDVIGWFFCAPVDFENINLFNRLKSQEKLWKNIIFTKQIVVSMVLIE